MSAIRAGRGLVMGLLLGLTSCSPQESADPGSNQGSGGARSGGATAGGGTPGSGGGGWNAGNPGSGGGGGSSSGQGGGETAGSGGSGPGSGGSGPGSGGAAAGGGGSGGASPADARPDTTGPDQAGDTVTGSCPGASANTDPKTCLTWQKAAGAPRTNVAAAKYCDQLVEDGHSDWRVPAPEELATWPSIKAESNAYITNPTYIPTAATTMDGCTTNAHSCNLTMYNAGSPGCGWQGVGFAGPTICVRGTASPGTTNGKFAATTCEACKVHLTGNPAEFKAVDCLPYAP